MSDDISELRSRFRAVVTMNFTEEERLRIVDHAFTRESLVPFKDALGQGVARLILSGWLHEEDRAAFMRPLFEAAAAAIAEGVARIPGLEPMTFEANSVETAIRSLLDELPDLPQA